ncbi:MAG: DNA primase [Gammaproteobacteria bacterium]|jgi:DNA primase
MSRIPQSFIDDLLARVDIVEVIDARVPLKKSGHEYKACCPFHNEKTPSFYVSPGKQFYHCFGCGAHGTAIGFLMEYEHMDFVEAVESLAQSLGLEVPREGPAGPAAARAEPADDLYALNERAAAFFRDQLKQSPQAIGYLKSRGLTGQTAAAFGLGYAPNQWDALLRHLDVPESLLEKAGLVSRNDRGQVYDKFRHRIMFPIRDRRGRVIGFGGRILGETSEGPGSGGPKYLNSPETPVFHKGRSLYGLFEARKASTRLERLMIVEGYMDVIALAQQGIPYAVATLGTATTREHVEQLFRVVPELVYCFDGDRAGRQAAWRALENTLPALQDGREVRFLFLPEGEDPDTLVRKEGKDGFEDRLDTQTQSLSDYLFQELEERSPSTSLEGRARLAKTAGELIRELPEGLLHAQILNRLADLTGLDRRALGQYLPKGGAAAPPPESPEESRPRARGRGLQVTPVRVAIACLLSDPELAAPPMDLDYLRNLEIPGVDLLHDLLETLRSSPHLTTAALLERWRDTPQGPHLAKLAGWSPEGMAEVGAEVLFRDALQQLARQADIQRTEVLLAKSRRPEGLTSEEKSELQRLFKRRGQG